MAGFLRNGHFLTDYANCSTNAVCQARTTFEHTNFSLYTTATGEALQVNWSTTTLRLFNP